MANYSSHYASLLVRLSLIAGTRPKVGADYSRYDA